MRVTVERKPSSQVLGIPAVLLEAECAIVAHKDVHAMVVRGAVEGCYDSSGHGGYFIAVRVSVSARSVWRAGLAVISKTCTTVCFASRCRPVESGLFLCLRRIRTRLRKIRCADREPRSSSV